MMTYTMFHHTHRPGFLLGFIDFFTAGLFFLFYMPLGGLQEEIETILGHKVLPYWKAYLWGVPTAFIYTLVWMARIAEELKAKAIELGIEGPHTSSDALTKDLIRNSYEIVKAKYTRKK
jgi:hypothetical protein